MNGTHRVVRSFASILKAVPLGNLDDALGGANATRQLRLATREAERALRRRRELQRACAETGSVRAWLAYAENLLREDWLLAAAGVLRVLRREVLEDLRPEALLARGAEVAEVRALEARMREIVEALVPDAKGYVIMGTLLEDWVRDAPSADELLDPAWLEAQEARTGNCGKDTQAVSVTGLAFSYMPWWSRLLPTQLVYM